MNILIHIAILAALTVLGLYAYTAYILFT